MENQKDSATRSYERRVFVGAHAVLACPRCKAKAAMLVRIKHHLERAELYCAIERHAMSGHRDRTLH